MNANTMAMRRTSLFRSLRKAVISTIAAVDVKRGSGVYVK